MSATASLRPPAPKPPPAAPGDGRRVPERPPRPSMRRALAIGLAVSALVHLLVFVVSSSLEFSPHLGYGPPPTLASAGDEAAVMQLYNIVPVPERPGDADEVVPTESEADPLRPATVPRVGAPGFVLPPAGDATGAAPADRLR